MARTEHDSWDLATSVGATATGVAAARALASQGPDPLLDDPYAEPLVRAVGIDAFIRLISGDFAADGAASAEDPAVNPRRMAEQMAVRTRFFDSFFIQAGEAGIRQAVILASGLDTRAYRLPWLSDTVVYEIDQPQVIEFKTKTLTDLGAIPTADRRPLGIDLRDDWPTALRQSGFDTSQPTAWSAEGLLVYLPPEAQDRLFDNITALSALGSRLATEHIPDLGVFTNDSRMQALTQRWRRYGMDVDFSELIYDGERSHVVDYLTGSGWQTTAQTATDLYAANGFESPDDEMMVMLADMSYLSATLSGPKRGDSCDGGSPAG